jgi:peptidylprolyl isomerase
VRRLAPVLAAALVLVLGAAGCGDDEDDGSPQTSAQTAQETETRAADPKDTSVKPVITQPTGSPPRRLEKEDIVKGKGPAARPGDTVSVNYVGVAFSNGQQFDASWDRGEPITFQLGAGQVIPGWDRGVAGMRVGGRRELVIPPELAYGPQGNPPIGPNETLIFVVDLESID